MNTPNKQFAKDQKLALEELVASGIIDERDADFLEHLETPVVENGAELALEGIARAVVHGTASHFTDMYREIKGWFLEMESKRKYVEEICLDLIEWCDDKRFEYRGLKLDMGSFKTWMKTSEMFRWRYYFLLNNETWNNIEIALKKDNITELENLYSIDISARKNIAMEFDSVKDIEGLIKLIRIYRERSNIFFKAMQKRKTPVKQFPFQVVLLGATDLRRTVKKIVNLAI